MKFACTAMLLSTLAAALASADPVISEQTFDKAAQLHSMLSTPEPAPVNATSLIDFFSTNHADIAPLDATPRSPAELLPRQGTSTTTSSTCSSTPCLSSYDKYQSCPDTTLSFLQCFCRAEGLELAQCYSSGCSIKTNVGRDVSFFVLEACVLYLSGQSRTASECLISRDGYSVPCRQAAQYAGGSSNGGSSVGSSLSGSVWSATAVSASSTPSRTGFSSASASATSFGSSGGGSNSSPSFGSPPSFGDNDNGGNNGGSLGGASVIGAAPSQTAQGTGNGSQKSASGAISFWAIQAVVATAAFLALFGGAF